MPGLGGSLRPNALLGCLARVILVVLGLSVQRSIALSLQYCSSLNTGSDFNLVSNIWQSNGACFETCKKSYAFAIVQGNSCWCSNYVPGSTTSTGSCSQECPGFPSEKCGSSSGNLFGYIALNKSPSGTQGGSSSSTPSSTQASTSATPSSITVSVTVTASPSAASSPTPSPPESSTPPPTTLESSTTTPSSVSTTSTSSSVSSWTPTPVTSVMIVTGGLRTVTITPTEPPKVTAPVQQKQGNNLFSNAGKVAGLFVGLALIIVLSAALILFCCWRRRQRRSGMVPGGRTGDSNQSGTRSRSISELGLIRDDTTVMGEKSMSRLSTGTWAGIGPSHDGPTSPEDRRNSNARIVDQRLDPGTLWNATHANSSRISVRSLQDDRDYSRRVLRLANPDS